MAADMARAGDTPPSALLAMGEAAGHLARRADAARDEFAGRFAAFAAPGGRRRLRELVPGAPT